MARHVGPQPLRGLNPWPRISAFQLEILKPTVPWSPYSRPEWTMARHVGWTPDQGFYKRSSNQLYHTRPWLLSTIMLAWDVHEREDKPEMANVLKNLVVPQKLAQIWPRRYKHDSIESSIRKSQQGGGNKSQIYPLTVKETAQMPTMHMLHSKHFFTCNANAILDKN